MRVAVAGLGTIGRTVARRLADGVPGLTLSGVAARDEEKARGWLDEEGIEAPIVALDDLPERADMAVECAPAAVLEQICRPMLTAGKQVMVLSCGALLPRPDLIDLARQNGGRIVVPTGGLLGLDAVAAAAEGTIHAVQMTTRKPPNGLAGVPFSDFVGNRQSNGQTANNSLVLRGYVRTWMRHITDEYDRVGLLDRLYDRTAAAA